MTPPVPFPQPDYDNHPGYGRQFGARRRGERLAALRTLAPFLWRALAENVYYAGMQALRFSSRRSNAGRSLEERGAIAFPDPAGRLPAVRQQLAQLLATDFERLDLGAVGVRDFLLRREQAPEIFAALDRLLEETGALDAAAAYLRRRGVSYTSLNVKVSGPSVTFKRDFFRDVGEPDPPTRYLHIDSSPARGVVKSIVYLSPVTERTGPFSYVIGSHRFSDPWLQRIARRAVHKSRTLQRWAPEQRRLFYALPAALRHKAEVGNDLRGDDAAAPALLAAEKRFTSADGAIFLFDNAGLHRGGLVDEGRRIIVQIVFR